MKLITFLWYPFSYNFYILGFFFLLATWPTFNIYKAHVCVSVWTENYPVYNITERAIDGFINYKLLIKPDTMHAVVTKLKVSSVQSGQLLMVYHHSADGAHLIWIVKQAVVGDRTWTWWVVSWTQTVLARSVHMSATLCSYESPFNSIIMPLVRNCAIIPIVHPLFQTSVFTAEGNVVLW